MQKGFWYLATPYSKHPGGIEEAFRAASREAALYVRAGIPVVSPIAHTHPIAAHGGLDFYDHSIWMPMDEPLMAAAVGLIVVRMPTWEQSKGIQMEIAAFRTAGKPIVFTEPGYVPVGLIRDALTRRYLIAAVYQGNENDVGKSLFDGTPRRELARLEDYGPLPDAAPGHAAIDISIRARDPAAFRDGLGAVERGLRDHLNAGAGERLA